MEDSMKDKLNQWTEANEPKKAADYFINRMAFTIGPGDLFDEMKKKDNVNIIDVRSEEDFKKGHIPGAINLPEEKWPTLLGLNKDLMNVIYCYSMECHLAAKAAAQFAKSGFHVMELQGGYDRWKEKNFKIETEE